MGSLGQGVPPADNGLIPTVRGASWQSVACLGVVEERRREATIDAYHNERQDLRTGPGQCHLDSLGGRSANTNPLEAIEITRRNREGNILNGDPLQFDPLRDGNTGHEILGFLGRAKLELDAVGVTSLVLTQEVD